MDLRFPSLGPDRILKGMCGRYVNSVETSDLVDEFDVEQVGDEDYQPSWNIAPTDPVRIVAERVPRADTGDSADAGDSAEVTPAQPVRQLRTARWGLVPSWSKDRKGAARLINARIETVTTKPAFRKAAASRRCLLPAQGYYEWQRTDTGGKVPYFLRDPEHPILALAGLYEFWRDETKADDDPERWLLSATIITQQATDTLGEIHDRNPVIVPPELFTAWLDCRSADVATAQRVLEEIPPARLDPYVVGPAVGNVRNNGPELLDPAEAPQPQLKLE